MPPSDSDCDSIIYTPPSTRRSSTSGFDPMDEPIYAKGVGTKASRSSTAKEQHIGGAFSLRDPSVAAACDDRKKPAQGSETHSDQGLCSLLLNAEAMKRSKEISSHQEPKVKESKARPAFIDLEDAQQMKEERLKKIDRLKQWKMKLIAENTPKTTKLDDRSLPPPDLTAHDRAVRALEDEYDDILEISRSYPSNIDASMSGTRKMDYIPFNSLRPPLLGRTNVNSTSKSLLSAPVSPSGKPVHRDRRSRSSGLRLAPNTPSMSADPSAHDTDYTPPDPPPGYVCALCGQTGHWVQSCPNNNGSGSKSTCRAKRSALADLKYSKGYNLEGAGSDGSMQPAKQIVEEKVSNDKHDFCGECKDCLNLKTSIVMDKVQVGAVVDGVDFGHKMDPSMTSMTITYDSSRLPSGVQIADLPGIREAKPTFVGRPWGVTRMPTELERQVVDSFPVPRDNQGKEHQKKSQATEKKQLVNGEKPKMDVPSRIPSSIGGIAPEPTRLITNMDYDTYASSLTDEFVNALLKQHNEPRSKINRKPFVEAHVSIPDSDVTAPRQNCPVKENNDCRDCWGGCEPCRSLPEFSKSKNGASTSEPQDSGPKDNCERDLRSPEDLNITYWATVECGGRVVHIPIEAKNVSGPEKAIVNTSMKKVWKWVQNKKLDDRISLQDAYDLAKDMHDGTNEDISGGADDSGNND